ncbi:C4-dicarboxylate TRAP transporter substrate-binding protein [Shumkonia mesophila]|uniref:C4-dicarboxylate TRAP transporter substrate-binding protein n=1 Tax=Shumkonia mesophila TaxID=2838854 RepID=UPI002934DDFD|nr:C4-dicarboxylate TRAP transporter substrate-binding protein [Shumkonia mesophila]
MKQNRFAWLSGAVALAGLLVTNTASADWTLNVGTALSSDDSHVESLLVMAESVKSRTNGRLKLSILPANQLGSVDDVMEQALAGSNVAVLTDGGRLASYVKELGILTCPYIADDANVTLKITQTPTFASWVKELRKNGFQVLAFNWWHGTRHLLTNKEIKSPDNLKGLRIRTAGTPTWMESIRAMGATPTPMPWTEVYPAMEQKVIDGAEAQTVAVWGSKLQEVVKYMTKTGHFNHVHGFVTGVKWFDGLPKDIQDILLDEWVKAGVEASKNTAARIGVLEDKMRAAGMIINDIDTRPFRERTAAVYTKLGYEDIRKKILAEIK